MTARGVAGRWSMRCGWAGAEQLRLPFALERTWIQPVLRRDPDLALAYRELLEPDLASSSPARVTAQPGRVTTPRR